MSAELVQAQYEQLGELAQRFGKQAEAYAALQQTLKSRAASLRGAWQGRGADAFHGEMDAHALPALGRLVAALREAQKVTLQMSALIRQAEEEAAKPFGARDGAGAQLMAAGPGAAVVAPPGRDGETPLPGMPAPPPQPGAGDGSAPYGSAGAPTDADWETHRAMEIAALGARLKGLDVAADHMQHYLDNTGEPVDIDVNRMLRDMPEFQTKVDQQFQREVGAAIQQQMAANYHGQAMEFPVTTGWRSDFYPSKDNYPDWFFGVGGFSYSQTAIVTVTPDPNGGAPEVSVRSQVFMFDRYNWDKGKSVTIPSTGFGWIDDNTVAGDYIPDTQMARLHETGIAREFEMRGHSDETTTRYRYDPGSGQLQEQPSDPPLGR